MCPRPGWPAQSLGFMVLFLWFQRVANVAQVIGIIGGTAEMECFYSGKEQFVPNKFRIIWQKQEKTDCPIDIYEYSHGEDMKSDQCNEFQNRTLFSEHLKKGNFSLRVLDINPDDDNTYKCVVLRNETGGYHLFSEIIVTLKVAAHYSKPVINVTGQPGEEMIFVCNSSHGYPQANLTWINQTDNSLLNATKLNATRNSNGTFSISSTLRINATSDTKLGCRIENPLLHQNITTTFTVGKDSPPNSSKIDSSPAPVASGVVIVIAISAIAIAIIIYICRNKRRRSHQRAYTGVCKNEAEHCNGAVELENIQRF
uniref:ICOS ligand n=1 Tax=Anolis carolinensis TaxID=28377 RepID=G1KUG1_ANOCA